MVVCVVIEDSPTILANVQRAEKLTRDNSKSDVLEAAPTLRVNCAFSKYAGTRTLRQRADLAHVPKSHSEQIVSPMRPGFASSNTMQAHGLMWSLWSRRGLG
jgi:hypothetical protein